ncbi:dihydrodipicolinate reductase [Roseovarius sp. LXJ103]|uniref:dihydrodipicolinate reductase n=1 Tax=Roseovarius carneus TaxID=2853164 RepID=UPI000D60CFE7|nr:dihydrodipicolinate reductase [Roseovarius carneus]MBZ8117859.1 dihydrodipicolinate reductase [Roseovarius carneus]PWE36381.1 dihydrodipicolinate reductase [Pelagicola sp. LXJ1103]
MRHLISLCIAAVIALPLTFSTPAAAQDFSTVQQEDSFVSLVDGRKLTRFGINLDVTPDGRIIGRAFGRDVTGAWNWDAGYFCRDLFWGARDLGANCQMVKIQGNTIRFISDKGTGQFADLLLK